MSVSRSFGHDCRSNLVCLGLHRTKWNLIIARAKRWIWDDWCMKGISVLRGYQKFGNDTRTMYLLLPSETASITSISISTLYMSIWNAPLKERTNLQICNIEDGRAKVLSSNKCYFDGFIWNINEMWAVHGGTAIPGQPVPGMKQASDPRTNSKNQFNIWAPLGAYQILSW